MMKTASNRSSLSFECVLVHVDSVLERFVFITSELVEAVAYFGC